MCLRDRLAVGELERRGYELVDVSLDNPNWKEAFLRPSTAHGTLIQVARYTGDDKYLEPIPRAVA